MFIIRRILLFICGSSLLYVAVLSAPVSHNNTPSVAFSAGLTTTQHIQDKETVIYDTVYVNEQDGYDASTGIFTCPIAGVYAFHFHGYSTNKDVVMWLELTHNDQTIVSLSGYNSHSVSSNSVLLKLRKGDRVLIQSKDSIQFSLFGLPDQVYSTFTGYLLHTLDNPVYMDATPFG